MYSLETMTGFPLKVKRVSLPHSGGALKCFYWYLSTRIFELLSSSSGLPKGQLILKYLFGIFNSPPKEQKKRLYYYGTSSRIVFFRFLGELKTQKRHFEINWPLKIHLYWWYCPHFWEKQASLNTLGVPSLLEEK